MSLLKNNNPLIIAIISGLATAPLYCAMFMLAESPRFSSLLFVVSALAIVTLAYICVFLGLWVILSTLVQKKFRLNESAFLISLAVFVGLFSIMDAFNGLTQLSMNMTNLFRILIYLLLVFFCALGSYSLTCSYQKLPNHRQKIIRALLFSLPFLAVETMLFLWWQKYKIESLFSLSGFLWQTALFTVVVAVTIFLIVKAGGFLYTLKCQVIMLCCIFILPFVICSGTELTRDTVAVKTGHPIRHVILIIFDSLRADMLSCYGNNSFQTPNIDMVAHDGCLFTHAYADAPWTSPSVSSIMTGQSAFVHRTVRVHSRLSGAHISLAEYLNSDGYRTVGFVSGRNLAPAQNIGQGFQEYNYFPKPSYPASPLTSLAKKFFPESFRMDASSADLTQQTLQWIQKHKQQDFFLWLHYFDPHYPFTPPKRYLPEVRPAQRIGTSFQVPINQIRAGYFVPTLEERDWIKTLYECEVRYIDDQVGILMETLKQLGLYDDTMIIMTADHGEEFWEHGGFSHGHMLYNKVLHVPLIVKPVQSTSPATIETNIQLSSLAPTVLDMLDIRDSTGPFSSPSLQPLFGSNSGSFVEQPVVATGLYVYEEKIAVINKNFKYIHNIVTDTEELYDLAQDPDEKNSIARQLPDVTAKMRNVISEKMKQAEDIRALYKINDEKSFHVDQESLQELRSLGYVK